MPCASHHAPPCRRVAVLGRQTGLDIRKQAGDCACVDPKGVQGGSMSIKHFPKAGKCTSPAPATSLVQYRTLGLYYRALWDKPLPSICF